MEGHLEWRSCSPAPWSGRPSYSRLPRVMFQLLLMSGVFRASLCNQCYCSATLTCEKVSSDVQREPPVLQFVPTTSSSVCVPSLQIFVYTIKILPPKPPLLQAEVATLCLFSQEKSPKRLCSPLLDLLQYGHVSFVFGSPLQDSAPQA